MRRGIEEKIVRDVVSYLHASLQRLLEVAAVLGANVPAVAALERESIAALRLEAKRLPSEAIPTERGESENLAAEEMSGGK